ncbi:hypothetical protein ET495_07395 [Xylanimonas allomyrinae]|uniref:3,4-dihydroxy-2-butanone-4-phosphate synthase n=1 Tax=Xylanimonas allomyrinae TaxID=2509459 RepID=A0A4P6EKG8_9MICO|nr:3,4-dihydroxy-2-butanone-4-phosphate synthase [Xylanimonas allomyrinae]QAY63094.1 hypothetical protein ET495_07395 [Xylanimonas allomyrinae]
MTHASGVTLEGDQHDGDLADAVDAIAAIRRGEMVVVVDDADRENEGDLIVAAEHATPGVVNFMIANGKGLVCLALTGGRAEELRGWHDRAPRPLS